jgi:hypothetical protein
VTKKREQIMLKIITCFIVLSYSICAQEILDDMQIADISGETSIKSTIIRDPEQSLLIVKTQIADIRIQSNNIIIKIEQVELGTWHLRLNPGTHRFSFQAPGFISVQQRFYFNPKDVKGVRITVLPAAEKKEDKRSGNIVINSTPENAKVFLNDQFYGSTPYVGKLLAGRYELKLEKDPYQIYIKEIIVLPGEILPQDIVMNLLSGRLQVISNPAGALVEINDQNIGNTPLDSVLIPIGKHQLKVSKEKYISFESEFEISKENISPRFNISLARKEAVLNLNLIPADALIEINNNKVNKSLTLDYGEYDISITKPGFNDYSKTIKIDKNEPYNLNINLEPKSKTTAFLYSTILPGSGQIYSGNTTKGIIIGITTIGAAATFILLNQDYSNKRKQYLEDQEIYENTIDLENIPNLYITMEKSYDEMKNTYDYTRIMVGITGVVWLYNILDSILFFPDQSGFEISASEKNGNKRLSLNINF